MPANQPICLYKDCSPTGSANDVIHRQNLRNSDALLKGTAPCPVAALIHSRAENRAKI